MILVQILGWSTAILLLLYYFGYGIARLLTPDALQRWQWVVPPFVGMAVIIVWGYLALFVNVNLSIATGGLFATVTLVNLFEIGRILRRRRTLQDSRVSWMPPGPRRPEKTVVLGFEALIFL